MILDIARSVTLPTSADRAWEVLRRPERVARCLPNVEDFREADQPGRYETVLVERLGPFRVRVPLTLEVTEEADARAMRAAVAGVDSGGQARVRGDVRAAVNSAGEGTELAVTSRVEVLGRLAALGAAPIRRRGDQVFDEFVANLRRLLEEPDG